MIRDNNYTGYACLSRNGETLEAVNSYKSVGMYQPCVFVENGVATSLKLGGLPNADGTSINKKVIVLKSI